MCPVLRFARLPLVQDLHIGYPGLVNAISFLLAEIFSSRPSSLREDGGDILAHFGCPYLKDDHASHPSHIFYENLIAIDLWTLTHAYLETSFHQA